MDRLSQMFLEAVRDKDGKVIQSKLSLTRVAFGVVLSVVLVTWVVFCFVESSFVDIPSNIMYLIVALGAVKATQKFGEN